MDKSVTEMASRPGSPGTVPSAEALPNAARLSRLNARARRIGWQDALREECEHIGGKDSWHYRYVTDPSRASFVELLELSI